MLLVAILNVTAQITKYGPDEVYYAADIIEGKNGRLFVSSSSGLYYSDDLATTWNRVDNSMNSIFFTPELTINQRNGYLFAGDQNGVFSSPDNGLTWQTYYLVYPTEDRMIQALGIDGDTLWVGTMNGLQYFQGPELLQVGVAVPAFQNKWVNTVHVDGRMIIIGTKYDGIFLSMDGGATWQTISAGLPEDMDLYGIRVIGDRWWAYGLKGLFFSDDLGATWTPRNDGFTVQQVIDVYPVGDALYALTFSYDNIWRLDAGSTTWVLKDQGYPTGNSPKAIWAGGDNVIVTAWFGIHKSADRAETFSPSYDGMTDGPISNLAVAPDGKILAVLDNLGIYSLTPGDAEFQPVIRDNGTNYGHTLLTGDSLVVVNNYKVSFSDVITNEPRGELIYHYILFAQDYVKAWGSHFIGTLQNGVYRYVGTEIWEEMNEGLGDTHVKDFMYNQGRLWVATGDGIYRRSVNDTQWTRVSFDSRDNLGVFALFADGPVLMVSTSYGRTFISNDGGTTWEQITSLDGKSVEAFTKSDAGLFAGSYLQIHMAASGSNNWVTVDIPEVNVTSMVVKDDKLYLGTVERGVWSVPLAEFSKAQQQISIATIPTAVALNAPLTLSATASSGLPITYTLISGPAQLTGNILTITGIGTVVVEASQPGNEQYRAAKQLIVFEAQNITSVAETADDQIDVYPNPFVDEVNMEDATNRNVTATLVDMQGRSVATRTFVGQSEFSSRELQPGIYTIILSRPGKAPVYRRVIKR